MSIFDVKEIEILFSMSNEQWIGVKKVIATSKANKTSIGRDLTVRLLQNLHDNRQGEEEKKKS